jgi:hypothetical protein
MANEKAEKKVERRTVYWQLRYRSPLSPTRTVDDVYLETDTDDEDDAKALADWWLANKVPSPSTRFVFVRRMVVATSAEMRHAIVAASRKGAPADEDKGGDLVTAAAGSGMAGRPPSPTDGGAGAGHLPDAPKGRIGS